MMARELGTALVLLSLAVALPIAVQGCAAVQTAVSHADLDVQTRMSATIFLDPAGPGKRVAFVDVRNTSEYPAFDLATPIKQAIAAKGYSIVDDPEQAHYVLQANVLLVGKVDPSAAEQAFAGGYGSIGGASLFGTGAGALATQSPGGALAGGLIGAAIATVADAAVKNVTYSIITDLQVSERSKVAVKEVTSQNLVQGTAGKRLVTAEETTEWKRYQTRIMSTANQVNLDLEDALPPLQSGMIRSIAGIF